MPSYTDNQIPDICKGCSQLPKKKAFHCYLDYLDKDQADVLFLAESHRVVNGRPSPLTANGLSILKSLVEKRLEGVSWTIATSIKCPDVNKDTITTGDKHLCRNHLADTVDKIKPKITFPLGNLAFNMLTKKSGITKKRGLAFDYVSPNGHECVVVPLYNPYALHVEPRLIPHFEQDFRIALNKYIHEDTVELDVDYEIALDLGELSAYLGRVNEVVDVVSIDIETTGLDFLRDTIQSITIGFNIGAEVKCIVIPWIHRESPWSDQDRKHIAIMLDNITKNENIVKVLQNGKFDMKFLIRDGVPTWNNVWDTMLMQSFLDEHQRNSLKDMVRAHFPQYLEHLI